MSDQAVWLFGRGASIEHGLTWTEPLDWKDLERNEREDRVIKVLKEEMSEIPPELGAYSKLLKSLKKLEGWNHLFVTTNWDFLLQREVDHFIAVNSPGNRPGWLIDSQVFHLNGSIENTPKENRSKILFETDSGSEREKSPEGNRAWNSLLAAKVVIVVGMSFTCEADKRLLLLLLKKDEANHLIGQAKWIIINPDEETLKDATDGFKKAMPRAHVIPERQKFENWLGNGFGRLFYGKVTDLTSIV